MMMIDSACIDREYKPRYLRMFLAGNKMLSHSVVFLLSSFPRSFIATDGVYARNAGAISCYRGSVLYRYEFRLQACRNEVTIGSMTKDGTIRMATAGMTGSQ